MIRALSGGGPTSIGCCHTIHCAGALGRDPGAAHTLVPHASLSKAQGLKARLGGAWPAWPAWAGQARPAGPRSAGTRAVQGQQSKTKGEAAPQPHAGLGVTALTTRKGEKRRGGGGQVLWHGCPSRSQGRSCLQASCPIGPGASLPPRCVPVCSPCAGRPCGSAAAGQHPARHPPVLHRTRLLKVARLRLGPEQRRRMLGQLRAALWPAQCWPGRLGASKPDPSARTHTAQRSTAHVGGGARLRVARPLPAGRPAPLTGPGSRTGSRRQSPG